MKLVSGNLMAEIDKYTINTIGILGAVLMENAGKGVYQHFIDKFLPEKTSNILIICGKGNNGGDGFVVARYLHNNSFKNVSIILLTKSINLKGDAAINYQICKNMEITINEVETIEQFEKFTKNKKFDYIFDAILGTGLKKEVKDYYKKIIEFINNSGAKIISVDIPSGLHSEKGVPLGIAVKAHLTCTFAYKKIGLSTFPGINYCGEVKVIDISIPKNVPFTIKNFEIDIDILEKIFKKRNNNSHKGTFGHVLILGGNVGFSGAVILAGRAALSSGCGLVTSIVPLEINNIVETLFVEGMSYPINFDSFDKRELINFINSKNAIVIGPGLGKGEREKELLINILPEIKIPIIIDADGLNILAENLHLLNKLKLPPILTPHPGEMSRLTGIETKEIQNSRIEIAKDFAKKYNVIVILKGFRTVITNGEYTYINPTGNSALATGGSGDVLSGMIASFVAQKYTNMEAAILATYLHGLAGNVASERKSPESVIAADIINNLHYCFKIFN